VVMVTYNVAPFILAAMESVLCQENADLELIVGDDQSTDNTWELVTRVANRDPRVKAFQQVHSGKPSVVRNAAMRMATGTHVAFLDGDDMYLPTRICRTMEAFAGVPGTDVVFHDVRRMAEDGTHKSETYLTESNFLHRSQRYWARIAGDTYIAGPRFGAFTSAIFCPIHTSAITVTAERLRREAMWFPEDLVVGEDIDLWFRLLMNTSTIYLDAVLSAYRERTSSLTRDRRQFHAGTIEADLRNLRRIDRSLTAEERTYYVRRLSRRYRFLATEHERTGDASEALKCYYRSFRLEPNAPAIVLGLKTLLPQPVKTLVQRFRGSHG
jgi:glycosyltransferase involved in cell wall biosynthesis